MNILFFCNEYPPFVSGGIGVFTKHLAEYLSQKGHNVYVYGLYHDSITEKINGVNVIHNKKTNSKYIGAIRDRIRSFFFIKNLVNKYQIDILEVQDFHGLVAFYRKLPCKIVTRLHGSVYYFNNLLGNDSYKNKIWGILERNSIKRSDLIISCSNYTAEKTKEIFNLSCNIKIIHNGVAFCSEVPTSYNADGCKKYLFYGSLIEKKGIVELIDAWIDFSNGKHVTLDIYGKDIDNLISIMKIKLDNCKSITVHPPISNDHLQEIIIQSQFCIFPTKAEAFSLAPIEAMSKGRVVLYSKQTSAEELISDKINGLLIPGTTAADILKTLEESYNLSIDECTVISKNARETVASFFDVNIKNEETLLCYEGLIKNYSSQK